MKAIAQSARSTETRINFLVYLFLLEEYTAELDAIINGLAAFGNPVLRLSERDWDFFTSVMVDPPQPNKALIKLFQDCS